MSQSQTLEIKERSTVKLSIYGRELEVKKPSFKHVSNMQALLEDLGDDGKATLETFSKFLEEVGLPKDLIEEMEIDHLTEVVRVLCEPKKK
jgi:hypothetical protein